MFIRFDMTYERDRRTGRQTDGQTPHDGTDRTYAQQQKLVSFYSFRLLFSFISGILLSVFYSKLEVGLFTIVSSPHDSWLVMFVCFSDFVSKILKKKPLSDRYKTFKTDQWWW